MLLDGRLTGGSIQTLDGALVQTSGQPIDGEIYPRVIETGGSIDAEQLQGAIRDAVAEALEQAKESGEFDGEKGDDGGYYTPYVNSSGILAWTASKAGMPAVAAANVKGKDGYTPIKGKDYFDGEPGYTPVKGVDYFDGEPGKTPVKGTDYFTEADKAEMVAAVIAALPVYGGETA